MTGFDEIRSKKLVHLWPITLLRVYTGAFFLYHGFGKLRSDSFADSMVGFLNGRLDDMFGFFRPFVESVVLPHNVLFAQFVSWGEFTIGLGLIVGLATRWASVAGAFLVACFWFAKGQGILEGQNHDVVWFMIFVVLATVHAGRIHSLDSRLADRFRFLA